MRQLVLSKTAVCEQTIQHMNTESVQSTGKMSQTYQIQRNVCCRVDLQTDSICFLRHPKVTNLQTKFVLLSKPCIWIFPGIAFYGINIVKKPSATSQKFNIMFTQMFSGSLWSRPGYNDGYLFFHPQRIKFCIVYHQNGSHREVSKEVPS